MAITAPFGQRGDKKIVPAGNHVARLHSIIHLGVQKEDYMGEEKEMDKVRLGFELPLELDVFREGEEPKPFVISQEYTLSMGEKANLRKLVAGIVPDFEENEEGFGVLSLMGKVCMLNVIHKTSKTSGNEYAQIASAAPLPKGMEEPKAVNEPFILDFEENWDTEKFNGLPEFLREKIKASKNFKQKFSVEDAPQDIDPSEIPF